MNINSILLAAGDSSQYGGLFSAGWEHLAERLDEIGVTAQQGDVLGTDVPRCMDALGNAMQQYPLIFILAAPEPHTATLVAALLAKGLGLELALNAQAQEAVQQHNRQVAIPLPGEDLLAFCTMPTGAVALKNTQGFLQGYAITARRQLLLVLPAAPSELMDLYDDTVGLLVKRYADGMQSREPAAQTVTVAGTAMTRAAAPQPPAASELKSQAETVIEVCKALENARLSVATAESGTSGALAQTLGSTQSRCYPPSSAFWGKEALDSLEVSRELLQSCGSCSPQAAAALALAARSRTGAALGASIVCGSPRGAGRPVAYLALTDGSRVWSKSFVGDSGNPHQLRLNTVLEALGQLKLYADGGGLPGGSTIPNATAPEKAASAVASTGITRRGRGTIGGLAKKPAQQTESGETDMQRTNLFQRIRRGKLTRNDKIRLGAVGLCICIFIGCLVYIGSVYKESGDNIKLSDDLRGLIGSDVVPDSIKETYPQRYQTKFAALYEQNADIVGWIKLDGTQVDYPVVQATDNVYYERKDFTRKDNDHGVPFADFRVDVGEPSDNVVIYAHNMNDGQMFGELMGYKSLAYYKEHPTIDFDSLYADGEYKVFGVVLCKKDDPDFNYHNYIDMDDKEMTDYVTKIRERSLINTNVDVRTDDKLLTLSTCDYDFRASSGERIARFVVFGRKVRPGEDATVDVTKATLNLNPVMPKEWYDTLARQQEAERKKQAEVQAAAVNKKWLRADEIASLSTDEQKTLAAGREENAKKYLTADERDTLDLDAMLYTISERQFNFRYFLTSDEQSSLSISKRISTSEERAGLAYNYLSDDEIKSAGKWSRIEALINERMNAVTGEDAKWLTEEERTTLSSSKRKELIASRKAEATAAGVTSAEIKSASSWDDIQALIASKKKTTPEQYIKQNPKWLDSGDNGLNLEDLQALVAERKDMASAAGIDISKYSSWSAMRKAIDEANAAGDTKKYVAANKAWLSSGEANKSLSELQALVSDRKAQATAVGLDPASLSGNASWTETKKQIDDKKAQNEQADAERKQYISSNLAFLNEGEKSLSKAELQALVGPRKAEATAAGVTSAELAACKSWSDTQAVITSKTKPPEPESPSTKPPDNTSSTPPPETPSSTPPPETPSSTPPPETPSSTTPPETPSSTPPPETPSSTTPPPEPPPPDPPSNDSGGGANSGETEPPPTA